MAKVVAAAEAAVDKRLLALEEQAEDLGEARKALDSAVNIARGLWFTFLSLSAYLIIAVGSVTHRDLFLETPVRLPLLNAELPLVTFFWVAPLMYLVIHGYLLVHLSFMADNARLYFGLVDKTGLDEKSKQQGVFAAAQLHHSANVAGAATIHASVMGLLIHAVVVLTVIIGPVLVLLLMQLQFLPYHSIGVTMAQRFLIFIDMAVVLLFWPEIAGPAATTRIKLYRNFVWACMAAIILFSGFVATFPGEKNYESAFFINRTSAINRFFFRGAISEVTGNRASWFSDTLALANRDFIALEEDKIDGVDQTVSLRGRDLRDAVLTRADLRKADFSGADLAFADLSEARLQGARFDCPSSKIRQGQKSTTNCTSLSNAILSKAEMAGASLQGAELQKVTMSGTPLAKANFRDAKLLGVPKSSMPISKLLISPEIVNHSSARTLAVQIYRKPICTKADLTGTSVTKYPSSKG